MAGVIWDTEEGRDRAGSVKRTAAGEATAVMEGWAPEEEPGGRHGNTKRGFLLSLQSGFQHDRIVPLIDCACVSNNDYVVYPAIANKGPACGVMMVLQGESKEEP